MKASKQKTYIVYGHKCPDGCIYIGSTSTSPSRRFNGGVGYANNRLFAPQIEKFGWNNIDHRVFVRGLDKDTARNIEKLLIVLTDPQKTLNVTGSLTQFCNSGNWGTLGQWIEQSENLFNWYATIDWFSGSLNRKLYDCAKNGTPYDCFGGGTTATATTPIEQHFEADQQTNQSVMNMKKEKKSVAKTAKIAGVKVELLTDNRYKNAEGRYAVCVRVYGDRKYVYIPTGYSMTTDEFANMGAEDERSLDLVFARVCAYVREKTDSGAFCIDCVKRGLSGETAAPSTTLAELLMERGCMHKNKGTIGIYKKASNAVLKVYPDGLPLKAVNSETVARLSFDMEGRLGLSGTTRGIYLGAIKSAINYGIYKGMMKPAQYPFKRNPYEIDKVTLPKSGKRDGNYLTAAEIQTLWNWFADNPKRGVGYFWFSFLHGGMNMADIIGLSFSDLYFDDGGFTYKRRKTIGKNNFNVYVPATTHTADLLSILGITPTKGRLVFPELQVTGGEDEFYKVKENATNRANRDLKKAAAECGIDKNITMTTARHTFATLANKSGMPYDMVERAMGHANNGVSGHYIGAWSIPEMRPEFEKLL